MGRAALAVSIWLALAAFAAGLRVPPQLEADDGAFVSIPLELQGEVQGLDLEYPAGFKLLSSPEPRPGSSLVNFFVERGLPSGEYPVRFVLQGEDGGRRTAVCNVSVRPRVDFAVETPPGREVLLGSSAQYWINVVNSGNVADELAIEVRVPDRGATVAPGKLELPAGGRGGFLLTVEPRSAQPLVVILALRSGRNPELVRYASVRTDVLPFAGAGELGSRSLRYKLTAEGGPTDSGWLYNLQATLAGQLSDYVSGSFSAGYSPDRPRLGLNLNGDWGKLGLSVAGSVYEGHASSGDWQGSLRYAAGALSGNLAWEPGAWRFGLGAGQSHQRFSAGYSLPLGRWLRLEPLLYLDRYAAGPWEAGGKVSLELDAPDWLASGRLGYLGGMLTASGEVARRRGEDYSFRGHWFYNGGVLGAYLETGQALSRAYWLSQELSLFQGALGWRFGLRYAATGVPWRWSLGAAGTNLNPGGYARLSYRAPTWETGASLGWGPDRGLTYSLAATLRQEGTGLTASYSRASEDVLGLRINHTWKNWEVSGGYDYSLNRQQGSGELKISYEAGRWALESGLRGDAAMFRWWLSGSLRVEGGFQTPEALVQTFGGRRTGRVWGQVYADANENGVRDAGEPAVAGAYLACGGARTLSDSAGAYSLEHQPGGCELSVQDPEGRFGLPEEVELTFTANSDRRLDLGLVPVAGVTGLVWLDANENGVRDEGERYLAGVGVRLLGPDGFSAQARSDARGRFAISYLPPGAYRLELDAADLPRLARPGPPLEMELEPGPLPFVGLPALPRELRRVQTFSLADATIYAELGRASAPPGAELPLRVTIGGMEPSGVFVESAAGRFELEPVGGGVYKGYLRVPDDASGAFFYRVVARGPAGQAVQEAMLLVRPGPLAALEVRPAFVGPGERVSVTARLLKLVGKAELRIGGRVYPLERQDELTWALSLPAPAEPGRYAVELWVNGGKWAEAAFRVAR